MAPPERSPDPPPRGDLGWGLGMLLRAWHREASTVLADVPGGARGFQVLAVASEDRFSSQRAVARMLGIDRTVMTYLLDDLEGAGLVHRAADPKDRRARRLVVTSAGCALLAERSEWMAALEDRLLSGLDDDERRTLRDAVLRVARDLEVADQVPDACALIEELDR